MGAVYLEIVSLHVSWDLHVQMSAQALTSATSQSNPASLSLVPQICAQVPAPQSERCGGSLVNILAYGVRNVK